MERDLERDMSCGLGIPLGAVKVLCVEEEGAAAVVVIRSSEGGSAADVARELMRQAGEAGSRMRSSGVCVQVRGGEWQGCVCEAVWAAARESVRRFE